MGAAARGGRGRSRVGRGVEVASQPSPVWELGRGLEGLPGSARLTVTDDGPSAPRPLAPLTPQGRCFLSREPGVP